MRMMTRMQPGINVRRYVCREMALFLSKNPLLNGISLVERRGSAIERECDDTDIWGANREVMETSYRDVMIPFILDGSS